MVEVKDVVTIGYGDWEEPCNPSSVRYDTSENVVVVVCQSRGTILHFNVGTYDQCALTMDVDSQVSLKRLDVGETPQECDDTAEPDEVDCEEDCTAHNIDYDYGVAPGWLFIALTSEGQITAVRSDNYTAQAVIHRDDSNYRPMDILVVGQ